jgi:hypothetical protein
MVIMVLLLYICTQFNYLYRLSLTAAMPLLSSIILTQPFALRLLFIPHLYPVCKAQRNILSARIPVLSGISASGKFIQGARILKTPLTSITNPRVTKHQPLSLWVRRQISSL